MEALELLQELFPGNSIESLEKALESSSNDVELASTIILSANMDDCQLSELFLDTLEDNEEDEDEISQLYKMFPNIDTATIDKVHNKYGDVSKTLTELLNHELLLNENIDEQMRIEQDNAQSQKVNVGSTAANNSWNALQDKIDLIIQFTGLDEYEASSYLYKNSMNPVVAIVNIINTYTNDTKTDDSEDDQKENIIDRSNNNFRKQITGGRVQRGSAFAHPKSKKNRSKNMFDVLSVSQEKHKIDTLSTGNKSKQFSFEFDPVAFNDMYYSDPAVKTISKKLMKKAFQYYGGNITNTFLFAELLIEKKLTHLVLPIDSGKVLKPLPIKFTTNMVSSKTNVAQRKLLDSQSKFLKRKDFSCQETFEQANFALNNLFINYKVDFHGFLINEAMIVLHIALERWWSKEISERELAARKISGPNLIYVSPFSVVTGRGIHSVGGISKIKLSVKKYLINMGYTYEEYPSHFIVLKKRTEH